ncbi:DNA cytosine methyltransferase [Facklamia sp. P12950]|uniref:DNA cytosine methyltransferase n=1 Tax=Facklamia sp. P12950 TaxID=3421951 RepID=UPI003D16D5D3
MLNTKETSEILKISEQYVRKLIKDNTLNAIKDDDNNWVVPKESINSLLQERTFVVNPDNFIRKEKTIPNITAVSFFSGAMGLDIGLQNVGIKPILAVENNKAARATIVNNHKNIGLLDDINNCDKELIYKYANLPKDNKINIFVGGPPCQAFSTAGNRKGFEDSRGSVLIKYVELIIEVKPQYFILENVRGLLTTKAVLPENNNIPIKGAALHYIKNTLEEAGYGISFELYNAMYFGAPQSRERFVIIGKLNGDKPEYLTPTNSDDKTLGLKPLVTLYDAISDIQNKSMNYVDIPKSRREWFKKIPEGGNWKSLNMEDQKKAMGNKFNMGGGKTGFFRRLSFNKPSPTLVTSPIMPATDLIHPTELRALSIEEYSRIQGFPDDYKFYGSIMEQYKQIGNAVPIKLGEAIGKTILNDMNGVKTNKYNNFRYSRYKNTSDEVFEKLYINNLNKEFTIFNIDY